MSRFNVAKVINSVPDSPEPNTVYFVRKDEGFDLYVTNSDGVIVPRALNADIQAALLKVDLEALSQVVDTKVDKVEGKQLSTNDFSDSEKTKLTGIAAEATKNATDTQLRDRTTHTGVQPISTVSGLQAALDGKVDKVEGQSLMLDSERAKLSGIAAGAQVNTVNSVAGKTGAVTLSKADVGLSNVDNISDMNKPVSTATQNALNTKLNTSEVGSTVASLVGGKVPLSQINDSIIGQVEYMGIWNAATNSPTLPATPTEKGHYYVTSVAGTFQSIYFEVGDWIISNGVSWDKVDNTDAVSSVAGKTGVVTLTKTDVGLGNVDNTSDANKPVSTAQQTALNAKVDKVAGKQLSTNDFSDAEKTKLSGIANNANNYVHPNSGVSAGTYKSVTVNAQGHVTGGSNPSTLSGYGITDAAPSSHVGSTGNSHGVATPSVAGFMSAADKLKLDGISDGAGVPSVTSVAGKQGAVTLVKGDVGLGNVDNTSDANKPVSTAQQTALNAKVDKVAGQSLMTDAERTKLAGIQAGAQVNVATNLAQGTRTSTGIPLTSSTGTGTTLPVATTTLAGLQSAADKAKLDGIAAGAQVNTVNSVAGKTGAVTLAKADVGLGSVDNTSDATKSIGGNAATATKLATARTINGVAFDGTANITVADATKLPLTGGTLSGDLVVGSTARTANTTVRALASDGYNAGFEAYGASQGTGYLYVGQASEYGGGIFYNGDGSPAFATGESPDTVAFYRRNANVNEVVFSYQNNNNNVTFRGVIYGNGSGLTALNASNLASGTIPDARLSGTYTGVSITGNAATATTLATGRTIGMTGDVTWTSASFNGSGNVTGIATLANSGVTAGTYQKVTVDAKGRVTAGAALAASDIPALDASKITSGTFAAARIPTLNQNTTGSAATLTTARSISITGDATWSTSFNGSANVTGALTLANSGVTAGTYPKVTVDSKGRVTAGASMVEADVPALSIAKTTGLQAALDGKAASTDSRILNGQTAYTWGNHAQAGYVKVDTTYSAMSVAEGDAGTATTLRTMRSDFLRQIISKIPSVPKSAAYTATAADRGKGIDTTAPVTIPADTFNVGDVLVVTNVGEGEFNISPATGVILRVAGTTDTGIVTLGAYGVVTLRLVSTNTWFVMGAGIK